MIDDPVAKRMWAEQKIAERQAKPLPNNPPPGPKWKAEAGLNRMNLNGVEHDVMCCLIDLANSKTGLCYPSEEYVAGWTNRSQRTVRRAIASLKRKRLLKVIRRGMTSNRYVINWNHLFAAFHELEAFRAEQKVAGHAARSGRSSRQKVAAKPTESEPTEGNHKHEIAPDGADNDSRRREATDSSNLGGNQESDLSDEIPFDEPEEIRSR
jgi:hypothetical protein